jgi:Arc/MetJ-type ribon-helix-helix transcriptional regulator
MSNDRRKGKKNNLIASIIETIESLGVEIGAEIEEELTSSLKDIKDEWKIVTITPDLGESVREMGESPRDHTVMVRVDEKTSKQLDSWVEIGAVKSRSEAAALFIREGLQMRADELDELEEALQKVEKAKQNLRDKARTVFGDRSSDED